MLSENGGGPLRKCTRMGQKTTSNHHKNPGRLLTNPLKVNFPDVISPRICIWSFPTFAVVGGPKTLSTPGTAETFPSIRKCTRMGQKNGWGSMKSPLAPQGTLKLDSTPPSTGPILRELHLIVPKLCFRKMVRGVRKCTGGCQKSTTF